jgi:uncharacterized protein
MVPASRFDSRSKAEQMLRLAVLALIVALSVALGACSDAADRDKGARGGSGSAPAPLLYEIARDDGAVRGWMLGTIHALPAGTAWRTPAINDAVRKADRLVVEVALADGTAAARLFRELAATPDLPPIAARLPPEHHARVATLTGKAGLDEAQQRRTESWAAALILSRLTAEGSSEHGVDRALLRDFAARPVRELEGARQQLIIFDSLPEDAQRALLVAVIEASEPARNEATRLRNAWLRGDLAALETAAGRGMMADPRLREALLTGRNRRWLAPIEAELRSPERPLIAVGAAHLVGPEGLIALLEDRGWRLTRI